MPRHCKYRRVCALPGCIRFGPKLAAHRYNRETVVLTLDEFETIRLIDLEGLSQEEAAVQMQVARTTVTSIYSRARFKLAAFVVKGTDLQIAGGQYELCDPGQKEKCRGCCRRHCLGQKFKGDGFMKIAVPYTEGQVFQHFGQAEQFQVYEIENNQVKVKTLVSTNGSGHGALTVILKGLQVDTLICGGIGGGAQMALTEAGIKFYGGITGSADQAVADLLAGKLQFDPQAHCDHHDHHHGPECRCDDHGCGEHHHRWHGSH